MTDDTDGLWLPTLLSSGVQQAGEQAINGQQKVLRQLVGQAGPSSASSRLGELSQTATFKTRVQSGGRISIPDVEREALDIQEGDIVQTVIVPVTRTRDTEQDNE